MKTIDMKETEATFRVRGLFQTIDIGFICKSGLDVKKAERIALKVLISRGWEKLLISEVKFKGQ